MGEKPFGDVIDELSCPDVMTWVVACHAWQKQTFLVGTPYTKQEDM